MKTSSFFLIIFFIFSFLPTNVFSQQTQTEKLAIECENENLNSCNRLGIWHESRGNHGKQAELFNKACKEGLAIACSNLGEQFYDGRGVGQDLNRSFKLFQIGCLAKHSSGCAGACLVVAKLGQLEEETRPACKIALKKACEEGNPWMCKQKLSQFRTRNRNSNTCEGSDLVRSRKLIENAWLAILQIAQGMGFGSDFYSSLNDMSVVIQRMENERKTLPMACQRLIQQWSNAMNTGGAGGGTQCAGGVCCDGTGCY